MKRVYFNKKEDRKDFFAAIKLIPQTNTIQKIAIHLNTYKSAIDLYISGGLTIPETKFLELIQILPIDAQNSFITCISTKDSNWGQIKGGKVTYTKHRNIFDTGRLSKKDTINTESHLFKTELTPDFCEFIGAFIGDGFIGKYGPSCMLQITGDATLDRHYYDIKLIPICKSLFPNKKICVYRRGNNTLRLTLNSKEIVTVFNERFSFPIGKKCYTVVIPDEILNSTDENKAATLRGIFDTDGCYFFDKRKSYKLPYPRIALKLASPQILEQIKIILNSFGIESRITQKTEQNHRTLYVNGFEDVKLFIEKIGSSNERHLVKIRKISPWRESNPRPA